MRAPLEAYAEAKGLPVDFLRSLGLSDAKYADAPAVRMPYVDRDGHEQAVRFRIVARRRRQVPLEETLEALPVRADAPPEGPRARLRRPRRGRELRPDALVPRHPRARHPGANNWKDDRDAPELEGIGTVYVVVEPDKGGQAVLDWLKTSMLTTGRAPEPRR